MCLGVLVNRYLGKQLHWLKELFPVISMMVIVLIIGIIIALNQVPLQSIVIPVFMAVVLHNVLGLGSAYGLAKVLRYPEKTCKTLAIEVGMQNSGLAVALAAKFFPAIAALPGAIFSIWHNISGALLASYWSVDKYKKE